MADNNEASPICRGKNLTWETVLLFYNNMPKVSMPKSEFNAFVESKINGWTQTHSQIARQLAFYYEENGTCYPRFTKEISLPELLEYMQNWACNYFIPNPYCPSLKQFNPVNIYHYLRTSIVNGQLDFDEVLDGMFSVKLSSHDKVKVYLADFTDLQFDSSHSMSINERLIYSIAIKQPTEDVVSSQRNYFHYFDLPINPVGLESPKNKSEYPLQQIHYGAPGTGKSHTVEQVCKQYKHHRTTFHPDSDYSTFVGCYKPTMEKAGKKLNMNLSVQDLAIALNGYYNDASLGNVGGLQKFVYEYYKYLNGDIMATNINQLLQLAGVSTNYAVEVNKYIKFCKLLPKVEESKITYSFVPQTFIQAYTEAWQYPNEPVFLVIEEINRGNCAQIFGDIFQLLDRNDEGWSSYAIDADKDLQGYLCDYFAENGISENAPEDIKSGKKLLLPPNLYIWATMNTSDQSLFPIDSAFKRRWDWKYVPIDEEKENWAISVNGTLYSWSSFLRIINDKIYTKTNSEDKQLGFYFCKAKDGIISADKFVSKVLFYIYNDIYKDYGFDDSFFNDDDNTKLSFRKYYDRTGNVNEVKVEKFLMNLGVEVVKDVEGGDDEEEEKEGNDNTKYSFNGKSGLDKKTLGYEIVIKYLEENPNLAYDDIERVLTFDSSVQPKYRYKNIVPKESFVTGSYLQCYNSKERTSSDGVAYKVLTWWNKYNIEFIIGFAKEQGWDVRVIQK